MEGGQLTLCLDVRCLPLSPSSSADIFCHFMGGILTCWYIVESWHYVTIWYLWAFFK